MLMNSSRSSADSPAREVSRAPIAANAPRPPSSDAGPQIDQLSGVMTPGMASPTLVVLQYDSGRVCWCSGPDGRTVSDTDRVQCPLGGHVPLVGAEVHPLLDLTDHLRDAVDLPERAAGEEHVVAV